MNLQTLKVWATSQWQDRAIRHSLVLFITLRLLLSIWGIVSIAINPVNELPIFQVSAYLGQPVLSNGWAGLLLGPWQRFDTLHYTRIAIQGYAVEADSVFPPLFPAGVRLLGTLFGGNHVDFMLAGILISNIASLGLFILLHRVTAKEMGAEHSLRALLYLALFPAGFFLFAPYTESLFILLALGSVWAARNGRFTHAGILGLFASLTRLTGWILIFPLAYEFWRQHLNHGKWKLEPHSWNRQIIAGIFSITLPAVGFLLFVGYRAWLRLPSLPRIYEAYWYQVTGFPGTDLLTALKTMFLGGASRAGEFTLWFDFFCAILLIAATVWTFRELGITWGLYSVMLLLFMLLPVSDFKPLYSFSRYTLAFMPLFMLLARAGKRPLINRLILYPSFLLYLYFSGQFFSWGWVG